MVSIQRQIGSRQVTAIGFGCMNLSHAYASPPPLRDAHEVVHRALDRGVTHFDTAALYGFGRNESLMGEVLAPVRSRIHLASKCGMTGVDGRRVIDGRPQTLKATIDISLTRLRTDLIDLWSEGRLPIRSILMVTHNIEEAVLMSDRILLMSSAPGRITSEIKVDIPQPRRRQDTSFRALVDDIYARMTTHGAATIKPGVFPGTGIGMALPRVSSNALSGLMEALAGPPYDGQADLPLLADALHIPGEQLLRLSEVLQLLRFAELAEGDAKLTHAGRRFAALDVDERKALFRQHLLAHVPIAAHIRRVLDERPSHRAPMLRFKDELEDHMGETAADQTLRAVISLARYGEVFAYDEQSGAFNLDNPT